MVDRARGIGREDVADALLNFVEQAVAAVPKLTSVTAKTDKIIWARTNLGELTGKATAGAWLASLKSSTAMVLSVGATGATGAPPYPQQGTPMAMVEAAYLGAKRGAVEAAQGLATSLAGGLCTPGWSRCRSTYRAHPAP